MVEKSQKQWSFVIFYLRVKKVNYLLGPYRIRLDHGYVVQIVTDYPREGCLPDLAELVRLECPRVDPRTVLVPETVASAEVEKLLTQNAGECRAHHTPNDRPLGEASGKQVDVLHAVVN